MDPRYSAQEILLCNLCQTAVLQSHCELCHVNLCIVCAGKHLSDSSTRHNVVPYKYRTSTPNYSKCPYHTQKHCKLYCEKCDIPVCSTCISTGKHTGHYLSDSLQKHYFKTIDIKKDLKELKKQIFPTYEEIKVELISEKLNLEKHYGKLTTAVVEQGEDWHREFNIIVSRQKSEIDEMKSKHLAALNKQENEIQQISSDIEKNILYIKQILDFNDVSLTSAYKSRNAEFRSLPPKINFAFPSFLKYQINTEQLQAMFGALSALSITTEEHGYLMKTPKAISTPQMKQLLDEPELITTIKTDSKYLCNVTCLSDEEILICGQDKIMSLYNLQGDQLKSIQTKYGHYPCDIAVKRSGDLVYADYAGRTVNIVKEKQIEEMIRLQEWKSYYICISSSDDLLVTMVSDDDKQSKVVRYSGSTEKQTIQFDSEDKPLFSCSSYPKYLNENRNLDICVADFIAGAVVVVNQAGTLRFRYTGHPSTDKRSFDPIGITTDSQCQILIADYFNKCIHILDQDGQFLRYIDCCDLRLPHGLCVDTRDHLFVAEYDNGCVKKIKYM